MDRKQAKIYRKKMQIEQNRELYCILFVTRDAKTKILDPQRIIEAEVKYNIVKKERKRDIKINGLVDFEKEFTWMKSLKEKEDQILAKANRRRKIEQAKKAKAKMRKKERILRKQNKKTLRAIK